MPIISQCTPPVEFDQKTLEALSARIQVCFSTSYVTLHTNYSAISWNIYSPLGCWYWSRQSQRWSWICYPFYGLCCRKVYRFRNESQGRTRGGWMRIRRIQRHRSRILRHPTFARTRGRTFTKRFLSSYIHWKYCFIFLGTQIKLGYGKIDCFWRRNVEEGFARIDFTN